MSFRKNERIYYFLSQDQFLKKTFNACNYKLKYDYTNDYFLKKVDSLVSNKVPNKYHYICHNVDSSFLDCFSEILDDINDEELLNYLSLIFTNTDICKDNDIDYDDIESKIIKDNYGNLEFKVIIPNAESDSNVLYAALIHELIHFPQLISESEKIYENSEVLSMYFEYLMYEKLVPGYGLDIFINNRLISLKNVFKILKSDLYYAINPDILNIKNDKYSLVLASYISYIEGIEQTLNLIENKIQGKNLSSVLLNRIPLEDILENYNADGDYIHIKKLLK